MVTYTAPEMNAERVRAAFSAALAEMNRLEALLSEWRADSEISRINQEAGHPVPVDPVTELLIERALWVGELSGGAFDITFQSMSGLWKFGDAADASPRVPTDHEVQAARARVDYRRIVLVRNTASGDSATSDSRQPSTVQIGANQQIALGGLAKGYIVDQMASTLRQAGLGQFVVQAGGDLFAAGKKPDGQPWEAGIQDPRGKPGHAFAKIALEDQAFSTAGDYARYFFVDGRRYHHIIDPSTGYPATACRSVTVWAPTALLADLLDDVVFILGPERGLPLIDAMPGVGAVIVDGKNQLWLSKALRARVKLSSLPTNGE